MAEALEPVRPIGLDEVEAARERIGGVVLRTPLVRLDLGPGFPDIRLKLENLQPTNAYKIRGAANAVARLSDAERREGVWTVSAGNAGQGIAYAARAAGIPCTVMAIETAPQSKIERMRALGANLVFMSYDEAWRTLERRAHPAGAGRFIHPFDDHDFIVGHATMGLEILEDAPDARIVATAIGGGGLIAGVGSVIKARRPDIQVWGVEPETAAPARLSFEMGSPQVFPNWTASIADGAGGKSMFPRMWDRIRPIVDDYRTVSIPQIERAIRLMAEQARVISEGAGALPLAAVLADAHAEGPIVALVSGGNIDSAAFAACVLASA
jgi:threonine dehydratase